MISSSIVAEIGGLVTFIEIILSAVIGIFLLQNFKFALMENFISVAQGQISQKDFMRLNISMALGAVLLIVPGFLTDIIGILLQFEFFGLLIAKKILKKKDNDFKKQNSFKYTNKGDDDVIDVEIIDDKHTIDK